MQSFIPVAQEINQLAELIDADKNDFQHVVFVKSLQFNSAEAVRVQRMRFDTSRNLVLTSLAGSLEYFDENTGLNVQRIDSLSYIDRLRSFHPYPFLCYEVNGEPITNNQNPHFGMIGSQILLFQEGIDARLKIQIPFVATVNGYYRAMWLRSSGFWVSSSVFDKLRKFQTQFLQTPELFCVPDPNPIDPLPPC
jgi:hypothetical protein